MKRRGVGFEPMEPPTRVVLNADDRSDYDR